MCVLTVLYTSSLMCLLAVTGCGGDRREPITNRNTVANGGVVTNGGNNKQPRRVISERENGAGSCQDDGGRHRRPGRFPPCPSPEALKCSAPHFTAVPFGVRWTRPSTPSVQVEDAGGRTLSASVHRSWMGNQRSRVEAVRFRRGFASTHAERGGKSIR